MSFSAASNNPTLAAVRAALRQPATRRVLPVPPEIDEPVARLVHAEIGLAELFVTSAKAAGMRAELVHADDLAGRLVAELRQCGAERLTVEPSPLLSKLGVLAAVENAKIEITTEAGGSQLAILHAAVAETGTLVFALRGGVQDPAAARHLFSIVEPRHLVPDALDLSQRLSDESTVQSVLMLTGGAGAGQGVVVFVLH